MSQPQRPIGYYLKQADLALTSGIDGIHRAKGLTRSDWQVLNQIWEAGALAKAQLGEDLKAFIDTAELEAIVKQLMDRGWLEQTLDNQTLPQ